MRFRRFAAGFMAAIVVITSSVPVAYADWEDVIYETVMVPFSELTVHAIETFVDVINGAGNALIRDPILEAHDFWSQWIRDESLEYRDFVSTLDSTEASFGLYATGFSATTCSGPSSYPFCYGIGSLSLDDSTNTVALLQSLGVNDKVAIVGIGKESPYYMMGVYFDASGVFRGGKFENPFGVANASYFGVYSLTDLNLLESDPLYLIQGNYGYGSYTVLYSTGFASSVTGSYFAFDFSRVRENTKLSEPYFYFYEKPSQNVDFNAGSGSYHIAATTKNSSVWGVSSYYPSGISWDNSRIVVAPSGTDETSRTSSLMQALNAYNTGNSYVDNSTTVNYFIGSLGSDGSVTDTYSPALYDEETLIFTEPVTGNQYQTKGWTYDYTSRSYYMTLDSGTMYIDGTEVTAVYLVYGDDNVEISYLSGSGATELIRTDTFAYVMVSQSACNINGHINTVATTKEPTCTAAGERLYTCSVCGNQTVETIPQIEHTYADYSIQQEPTCTNKGIAANTCTTCGGQITELLDPLGHDWLPTSITDESWAMPDGVSCPDCHGSEYSYTRSDYEIVTGKNLFDMSKITVQPASASSPYISEVGSDYFILSYSDLYDGSFPFLSTGLQLRTFAPDLEVGKTYTLSFDTDSSFDHVYLSGQWKSGTSRVITASMLSSYISFYGFSSDSDLIGSDCRISNIQIEEGTVATEYEPYIKNEVEIIPPIYNFTCSDCSTEWTAEAVYQHAYTTFTCSRCGETMIQSEEPPMEEQDWFTGFGEAFASLGKKAWSAISSGIGKVFGGFVDLLGGIFGFFSDTVVGGIKSFFSTLSDDSILGYYQDDTGTVTLPEGMSTAMAVIPALFGGLPAELQAPVILGIAALFLIAALKLFL